ncbi:MAG: fatty acid desaturase [Deltaproteobacteria bacterium]|nr:MAG: fatty acid desaturase [Deltaproteobacteria bacterium]
MRTDFTYTDNPNPHVQRSREMIKKYPQIRKLMGPNPMSNLWIVLMVAAQIGLGIWLAEKSWWLLIAVAWLVGSLITHSLFGMVHEAAHNLLGKGNTINKVMGIFCNVGQGFPSAIGFRTYHLIHHAYMSEYDYDADLAFHWEAKLVKNVWWRKVIWYLGFLIIESIRPMKLKMGKLNDAWTITNIVFILAVDAALVYFFGWKALIYIFLSTAFGVGLHPVGARWIQEHYIFRDGQETYSYYGPLNKLSFNLGYHNEHHDFYKIPWNNLPKLKAIAPEYYDNLYYHTSWTKLFLKFIFDPKIDLYARIVRRPLEQRDNKDKHDSIEGMQNWNTGKSEEVVYS